MRLPEHYFLHACFGLIMTNSFVIMDEFHSELQSEHATLADAWTELLRLSKIEWDVAPNKAPCGSWQTCGRHYEIKEFDDSKQPSILIRTIDALQIDAKGVVWRTKPPKILSKKLSKNTVSKR
jgi:hypothetical protein